MWALANGGRGNALYRIVRIHWLRDGGIRLVSIGARIWEGSYHVQECSLSNGGRGSRW